MLTNSQHFAHFRGQLDTEPSHTKPHGLRRQRLFSALPYTSCWDSFGHNERGFETPDCEAVGSLGAC